MDAHQEDRLFGQIAVKLGMLTQTEVNEALREQRLLQARGHRIKLGRILLRRRQLKTAHIVKILDLQDKAALECRSCRANFLGLKFDPEHMPACPRCGGTLAIPDLSTEELLSEIVSDIRAGEVDPPTGIFEAPRHPSDN